MSKIIMFHSVGLDRHPWYAPHISENIDSFHDKMRKLHDHGYVSRKFTDPAIQASSDDEKLVSLTFDDGYLDNWVHVFPILERFGFEASIFVSTDFIDPTAQPRKKVEPGSVHDAEHVARSCCAGFLNFAEMRAMESSGLVEIQSHARTHTWYFKGPRIVDYWRPGSATRPGGPVWMLWNLLPEMKPFYLTQAADAEGRIPWGTPIYEHGKALETRRFFPDEEALSADLQEHVQRHGGPRFFERSDWRQQLDALVADVRAARPSPHAPGHYESEEDFLSRVRSELEESRRILGRELDKEIDALVWPGGGVLPEVVSIARDVGYRYFTLPGRLDAIADPSVTSGMMRRMTSVPRITWGGRDLGAMTGREFIWDIQRQSGHKSADVFYRASKSVRAIRYLLRMSR